MWQHLLDLPSLTRGFHRIDEYIKPILDNQPKITNGMLNLFLQHTSASLLITENCCSDVKTDLERFYNQIAPDSTSRYHHNMEGADDMPAHIKSSILGVSITVPIQNSQLALGQWQGIYLGEHRNQAGQRRILLTVYGLPQD